MVDRSDFESYSQHVISLSDIRATDRLLAGGKGANLATLIEAGLPVPDGFCVTTVAFRQLVDTGSIDGLLDELSELDPADTAAIATVGERLRNRIEALEMPTTIREAIENEINATDSGPTKAYAVRSSATAEDLPEASFAGQQETILNVQGSEAIITASRACMASLFTDRAIAYRAKNDIPHTDVALAVVVQRMITPDVSGVLFTADPMTGNRHRTAIEAGLGLGEAFVSGAAAADSIRVNTQTGEILEYERADQQIVVQARSEGGIETVELEAAERPDRVLTDEQIRTLVDLGTTIEALFEQPQDIEWCIEDGSIYILQSRPITSLFPVPAPKPTDDQLHVYCSLGHAQAFAEAMPPLVRDIWMAYTEETFEAFGFSAHETWAVEAGGRVYMDMTSLLQVSVVRDLLPHQLRATSEPMGAAVENILERRSEEFRIERSLPEIVAGTPAVTRSVWQGAKMSRPVLSAMADGFVGAFIGEPTDPQDEEAKWITWGQWIASRVHAPDTLSERVRAIRTNLNVAINYPPVGPLLAALVAGRLLEQLFPDAPEDVNAVGRGFPDELVTRINLGLGDLADVARANPAVADALREGASLETIESLAGGAEFIDALEAYLEEFGHRATGEIDISRPRWQENPSGLLATVRANLEHEQQGAHRSHIRQMEREARGAAVALEQRADHGLLGPVRRRLVRQLIRTYRGYIQTREYPKQGAAHMFATWRDVLCEAGEVLVDDGLLSDSTDVWFLRLEELLDALDGESIAVDIDTRRAEFERYKSLTAPPVLTSEGEAPSGRIEREDVPEGALTGTGVSGGVVEGIARVVRDPTTETIENGEILVAPSSDPGWTPLFLNAAGMVVEVGGRMSHGALVAREYGIPAVVSVSEATERIETGQRIRIDGTQGIVEIIG
ncbi:phosphoenolpyruvate synthase [Halalkalicoccus paucihalophilus]|uniref:Probable phosphoenolpyruvate synthase n=1 Tax=Halalkalicoccus paucihalophilus TaxID=1008153 RepID=A0A151A9M8_9EURY|nr:phosphoenolpyruvate synthase [Halalkalicoccus paucihalophilus]KYH24319.1 phosphoenolpyruvate synthase [Halalkalicoccus paucihalophilus]